MPEINSTANDRQVGGAHYRSAFQHWDWVEDYGVGYLAGCATKYLARWRKKDGLKDLEKAEHYVQKMAERLDQNAAGSGCPVTVENESWFNDGLVIFARENNLDPLEFAAVSNIAFRRSVADLAAARSIIRDLMLQAS